VTVRNSRPILTASCLRFVSAVLCYLFAAASAAAQDGDIVLNYGKYLGEPYAKVDAAGQLQGGLIKIVGEELAGALGRRARFMLTPRNRSADFLSSGDVDVILLSNPAWLTDSDRFVWTQPLFKESEVVVALQSAHFQTLDDVKGKRIGTTLGFKYFGPIGELLAGGQVQREDASSVSNSLQMLKGGRVDCVIGKLPVIIALAPAIFGAEPLVILTPENTQNDIRAAISTAASADPSVIKAEIERIFQRPDIQARILPANF
jgi:ABC-type amino acid transport substrate-binding protein